MRLDCCQDIKACTSGDESVIDGIGFVEAIKLGLGQPEAAVLYLIGEMVANESFDLHLIFLGRNIDFIQYPDDIDMREGNPDHVIVIGRQTVISDQLIAAVIEARMPEVIKVHARARHFGFDFNWNIARQHWRLHLKQLCYFD